MYSVKATIRHPKVKQRINWTGVFMPTEKKLKTNRVKIEEQTIAFVKKHIKLPELLPVDELIIKVEITKIKCDFIVVEDKID